MMMQPVPFSITADWQKRQDPRRMDDSDVALWSNEMRKLFDFVNRYDGPLTLHLGDLDIRLTLDDLPYVFEELDDVVDTLRHDGGESELYFAALGTDLNLVLRRQADAVLVTIQPGYTAPDEFSALAGRIIAIEPESFLCGWSGFTAQIRAALASRK